MMSSRRNRARRRKKAQSEEQKLNDWIKLQDLRCLQIKNLSDFPNELQKIVSIQDKVKQLFKRVCCSAANYDFSTIAGMSEYIGRFTQESIAINI